MAENPLNELNLDEPLDLEAFEDTGFEPLPAGWYNGTITGVELRESQNGNPYLNVEFTLDNNRKVWTIYMLNNNVGLSRLRQLVQVVAPEHLKSFRVSAADEVLVGKPVRVKVTQRKGGDGQVRNDVQQVSPPTPGDTLGSLF